jgi:hypothetical protein
MLDLGGAKSSLSSIGMTNLVDLGVADAEELVMGRAKFVQYPSRNMDGRSVSKVLATAEKSANNPSSADVEVRVLELDLA